MIKNTISSFKQKIKSMPIKKLDVLLQHLEQELNDISTNPKIQSIYNNMKSSNQIDEKIKSKYYAIVEKLKTAKEREQELSSINPTLYELYHLGECNYYYNGSVDEILEAEQLVKQLSVELDKLTEENPALHSLIKIDNMKNSDFLSVQHINILQRKIMILKNELSKREQENSPEPLM